MFLGRKDLGGYGPLRGQIAKKNGIAPLIFVLVDAIVAVAIGEHHQASFGKVRTGRIIDGFDGMLTACVQDADTFGLKSTRARMVPPSFDFY